MKACIVIPMYFISQSKFKELNGLNNQVFNDLNGTRS